MTEIDLTKPGGASGHRFNYRGQHRYIVTMKTARGESVFVDRDIILRLLTVLREACWKDHFTVLAYCCLPEELMLVLRGTTERSDLKVFLRTLRETSRQQIHRPGGSDLWHRTYTERVLRKSEDTRDVIRSIFNVPVNRGLVGRREDYPFSGSFEGQQVKEDPHHGRPVRSKR
jgi:REP element-mobilizing transposase RayT